MEDYFFVTKLAPGRYIVDSFGEGSGMNPPEYKTQREAQKQCDRLEREYQSRYDEDSDCD